MAASTFDIGDVVTVTAAFTDDADAAADPAAVKFIVRDPVGAETEYVYGTDSEATRESTGNYKLEYLVTSPPGAGLYAVRVEGTGANAAAERTEFLVQSRF